MIVTKVVIFRTLDTCQHSCNLTLSSKLYRSLAPLPSHSSKRSFADHTYLHIVETSTETLKKKRERENHVAIIFHGIHDDTRKYVNTRRKRCKESFSNEVSPAWFSRHRSESTNRQHGRKNSRDIRSPTVLTLNRISILRIPESRSNFV